MNTENQYVNGVLEGTVHRRLKKYAAFVLFKGFNVIEEGAIISPVGLKGSRIIDIIALDHKNKIVALIECVHAQKMYKVVKKLINIDMNCRKIILRQEKGRNYQSIELISSLEQHGIELIEVEVQGKLRIGGK